MKYLLLIVSLVFTQATSARNFSLKVVNNDGDPLSGVVIYATPVDSNSKLPINKNTLVIAQQNKEFSPYISVVQKGLAVDFENNDDITHHIYSVSGQNTFDFKIKAGNQLTVKQFNASEEVAMGCNIHDWMSGYLLVVDTPYYGVTNEMGNTSLDLNDEGDYIVSIWHPQLDIQNNKYESTVNFNLDDPSRVEYQIKVPAVLLELPLQKSTEDFEFLEEY